jgi:hypothetical protein
MEEHLVSFPSEPRTGNGEQLPEVQRLFINQAGSKSQTAAFHAAGPDMAVRLDAV